MQVVLCNLRAQLAHYLLHNQFTTSGRSSRRQPALLCAWGRRRLPLTPAPLFQRVAAPHPPRWGGHSRKATVLQACPPPLAPSPPPPKALAPAAHGEIFGNAKPARGAKLTRPLPSHPSGQRALLGQAAVRERPRQPGPATRPTPRHHQGPEPGSLLLPPTSPPGTASGGKMAAPAASPVREVGGRRNGGIVSLPPAPPFPLTPGDGGWG